MIWKLWAPFILQSDDGRYRIYKGAKPGPARYALKESDADQVWTTLATASNAEELKAMIEEVA